MNVQLLQPPQTETSGFVRSIIKTTKQERGAISSDPPMKLAAEFLDSLRSEYEAAVLEQVLVVLGGVRRQLRELEIPTIAPAPDGLIGMTWEGKHQHVNVQVHPDHRIEYFAEDLDTGALWSAETAWGVPSPALIEQLQRVW